MAGEYLERFLDESEERHGSPFSKDKLGSSFLGPEKGRERDSRRDPTATSCSWTFIFFKLTVRLSIGHCDTLWEKDGSASFLLAGAEHLLNDSILILQR